MSSVPMEEVELTIRCAHQSFPDQLVRCSGSWSVDQLKSYLHKTNPQYPLPEKQKLIYAGQLLKNSNLIKDVIRVYGPDHKQVLHLVYMPAVNKTADKPEYSDVRKRTAVPRSTASAPEAPVQAQSPVNSWNSAAANILPSSHLAYVDPGWQQTHYYHMYMANYMAYLQHLYGANGLLPGMGMMPVGSAAGIGGTNAFIVPEPRGEAILTPTPPAAAVAANGDVAPPAPAAQQAMNAQGGIDEEEPAERDWLDWCYFASRVTFLFVILYFYSSMERFLLVISCFIFFYGHQAGWFGRRNLANQNQDARPQEAPDQNANVPQDPAQNQQINENNGAEASSDGTEGAQNPAETVPNTADLQSAWQVFSSTCYTFVTSFFISLIPQRPAAVNA